MHYSTPAVDRRPDKDLETDSLFLAQPVDVLLGSHAQVV
jgi:hypothetical protein